MENPKAPEQQGFNFCGCTIRNQVINNFPSGDHESRDPVITFRVTPSGAKKLDEMAAKMFGKRSDVLRMALTLFSVVGSDENAKKIIANWDNIAPMISILK
ncbi:hypothetical protein Dalk_4588 [Desulfatibacillum aliphaticivorans]|uniref:Uncharacterized protein n=1 Tax=Desulfatibacillum aliphaticivorans TaxID=218208 RepID=B8FNI5_DESAL|nr:hypothetical protein [Desulfatibacillum aliphaticivorans]ACL06266.1 hypothetical protein Dalk_4588 [Desulfatibacillum aliphaticivorans]